jgi:hypothetical protein
MEIPHQLSEQDFVEAFRVHYKRSILMKWIARICFAFAVLMAAAVFGGAIYDPRQRTVANLLPISLVLVLWFFVLRIYPRWNSRRQFRKQPGVQSPRVVTFDATGAHWRWDGGSSDVAWKNYIRWEEGQGQILLYLSPASFEILPTRGLHAAQMAELREMLKQNIVSTK